MEHIIGVAGVILLLGAYFLVSTGRIASQTQQYQLMNLVGSAIGIWYSGTDRWVWATLNIVWCGIALVSLMRMRREK
jgi:hypothetical protein